MDVEGERVGAEGRKTKCLGRDQPGISPYAVPTHWLEPDPSSSVSGRSIPRGRGRTTQTLNDSRFNLGLVREEDESWVRAPSLFSRDGAAVYARGGGRIGGVGKRPLFDGVNALWWAGRVTAGVTLRTRLFKRQLPVSLLNHADLGPVTQPVWRYHLCIMLCIHNESAVQWQVWKDNVHQKND